MRHKIMSQFCLLDQLHILQARFKHMAVKSHAETMVMGRVFQRSCAVPPIAR